MVIPVGLLSDTERAQRRTRGRDDQGYWAGDRFVFTPQRNPVWPSPPEVQKAVAAAAQAAQQVQQAAQTFPGLLTYGDGPQGEGFSGGRDSTSSPSAAPGMAEAGHTSQGLNANVQGMLGNPAPTNPAGLPSLPDFKEQATPAAPTAPTNQDLAVSEVDPQGPSGAASAGKGTSRSAQAAADKAAFAAVDKALADDRANMEKGIATNNMTDAVAAATKGIGVATGVNFNDQEETGATTGKDIGKETQDAMNSAANAAKSIDKGMLGALGALNGLAGMLGSLGMGTGGGSNSNGPSGGPAGGNPGPGNDPPGSNEGQGVGGHMRKGGKLKGNRNGLLEAVPIVAHEGEFVQKPEAVSYYGDDFMRAINERRIPKKAALGLLAEAYDKPQSTAIDRGLLGI